MGIWYALKALTPGSLIRRYFATHGDGDLSDCPYYRGAGKCVSGCRDEPQCITDQPLKGWPMERLRRAFGLKAVRPR